MKTVIASRVLATAAAIGIAGCSGMKAVEKDVAELKTQMARLQSDVQSTRAGVEEAANMARTASQAANGAQSSANQALAATHSGQACCNEVDEKIDRAFRQAVSK